MKDIRQGANDEIFQGSTPILTGIDPQSSYIYLLEEAKDRTAETWEIYMQDRKDHGLNLDLTINDGAAGLISGITKVYDEVEVQRDVFHASYEMGKEVSKVERKTYSLIKQEYDIAKRKKPKPDKLKEIIPKVKEAVRICDNICILFSWLKELLGFSGYNIKDATNLVEFVLHEMEKEALDYPGLKKECEKIRKNLPSILSFINRLEKGMCRYAEDLDVPSEAFRMMYRQLSYSAQSKQCHDMEYKLALMLMQKYDQTREAFNKLLSETKKASSLVENLNGRIRSYIEIKRVIPAQFFVLLKVYFNTRSYRRSRCKERIGKSPLEILTGKAQPDFLEALGF